jgi:hypothetical protein
MGWFEFLSDMSSALSPYVTLIMFSIWFSFNAKREGHSLASISFSEAFVGFLIVIIVVTLYKVGFNVFDTYYLYTFISAVGILWGIQGLIWGLVFWLLPVEKILKIQPKKKT